MADRKKFVLLVQSGDVDKLYSACALTLGALGLDMDAHVFFTFRGLARLRKADIGNVRFSPEFFRQALTNVEALPGRPSGGDVLPPSGAGYGARAHAAAVTEAPRSTNPPSSLEEFLRQGKEMGNLTIYACSETMGVLGVEREDLTDLVDEVAGAVAFVAQAKDAAIQLVL